MKPYHAVLFDLDGTLIDTAPDLMAAANHVLRQHQRPDISLDAARQLSSHGAAGLLNFGFADDLKRVDINSLRLQLIDYYQQNICQYSRLFAGIADCLAQLNTQQIPWGIVTNKPEALTHKLLAYFPIFQHCKVVVGGDSLPQSKPDPAPMLFASQALKIKAEHCIYVGDAERDIQAGRNAQMLTVLASWGYLAADDQPHNWQADLSCSHSQHLQALLQGFLTPYYTNQDK